MTDSPDRGAPRRSTLFVPATRWDVIVKAAASDADAVCIDLEDSVAADLKEASRANVIRAFRELDFGHRARVWRVNGMRTSHAYRDIIEVVEAVGDRVDAVMIPKVSGPGDVQFVERLLWQAEHRGGLRREVAIQAQVETAAGFVWLREIAGASPRLDTLIFGAGDYAASMRMPATTIGTPDASDAAYPGHRWHAVMHGIVAAARAHGLQCIDGPFAAFHDEAGHERSCRVARVLGFDGKQCIHPSQVAQIHAVFGPSQAEVSHARRVVEAFDAAVAGGRGAATLDGVMIDEASVRMARIALDVPSAGRSS